MTSEEKAKELVYHTFWLDGMDFENSKQCALILVDELIKECESFDYYLMNKNMQLTGKRFWLQEVKQEIEKL
jgi:hypothetical protein